MKLVGSLLNVLQQANPNCTTLRLVAPRSILGGAGDLVSKVVSRVIIGVTPFGVLITLLITLLSPLPLQVSSPPYSGTELEKPAGAWRRGWTCRCGLMA